MNNIDTKTIQVIVIISAMACLLLAKVPPGLFSLWVLSPLIIIYVIAAIVGRNGNKRHITAVKGYLIVVLPLMWFIHILWYFDINGTATSSSTSAIIFAVLPVYALILGAVAYLIGYIIAPKLDKSK